MRIPILRLGNILLTSIQVDLTDEDVMLFQNDVVNEVSRTEAMGLAIDITALEIVDSFMARVINDTANMARLLGAEVVVCGIQPTVAMTLVEMGRGLLGAQSTFNLEQGLIVLRQRIVQRADLWAFDDDERSRDRPFNF
ncbi:STAS domain-containing protein [Thiorhodospira sibirica]|uniref:STAS domain-containing protein n=1 Tax=Thiorhodospira sibirica TaxID=154347 RepID=UPI00022C0458|nr:STAS domain-containing protein [Thiorhodospira sibirica]